MTLEIQVLAWDRHNNLAGLKRLMGSQPSPLFITITYYHKFEWQQKRLQYNSRVSNA
jgi:hypothetical protein